MLDGHDEFASISKVAKEYIKEFLSRNNIQKVMELLSTSPLSEGMIASVCLDTLEKFIRNESVNCHYIMGLAWLLTTLDGFPHIIGKTEST